MRIIGNDEYKFYKSEDYGKNWELLKEGSGDAVSHFDRIIIYGQNDDGLKYTDDNFVTINDSNIIDGNWIALQNDEIEGLYTTSMDGKGIYYSDDNGETWKRVSSGTGDQIKKEEDKVIIFGKGDVVEFPSGTVTPNATYKNNSIVQMLIDGVNIEDCLIYILNEIILPGLCTMLTGYSSLDDLNNFYNNEKICQSFFTDGELYKTTFEGIDFAADVGMMPFNENDIADYVKAKDEINNLNSENEDKELNLLKLLDDPDSRISKTFDIIEAMIKVYKDYITRSSFELIKNKKEDYSGLNTPEDKDSMRELYEVRKGAEASIVGTIINSVFTFSYSKKMALLKTSIFKTATEMKDSINLTLNIVKQMIDETVWDGKSESYVPKYSDEEILQDQRINSYFVFNLKKEWGRALELCIEDYYKVVATNINNISKSDDKEFISEAADKYSEIRLSIIDQTKDIILNSNFYNDKKVKDLEAKKNSFLNSLNNGIIDLLHNTPADYNPEEFNKSLDELIDDFYNQEDLLSESDAYIALGNNYKNDFLEKFNKEINIGTIQNVSFDKNTFEEYSAMYGYENIDKIFKYYHQILQEFKKRCQQLLEIIIKEIGSDYIRQTSINLTCYSDGLKMAKTIEEKNTYFADHPLKTYEAKETSKQFISMVKTSWCNMRDKI